MDTELAQQKSLLRWKKKIAYVRWDCDNSWFPLGFRVILVMKKGNTILLVLFILLVKHKFNNGIIFGFLE